MAIFVKIANKVLNPDLLQEELAPLGITGILFAGFERRDVDTVEPVASTIVYSRRTDSTGTTELSAEPGELHLTAPSDPGLALDTALTNHDSTNRSAGQILKDQIVADKATIQAAFTASALTFETDEMAAIRRLLKD